MHRNTLRFRPRLRFIEGEEGGAAAVATPAEPAATGEQAKPEPLGEGGIKALQAEREARSKAEATLTALQKEIEDGKKSAEEKASDALLAAQKVAAESTAKALRYEVAAAKGIPLALASRLTGATKEELEADADALKALIPDAKPGTPKPDPSAGASGDVKPKSLTDAVNAHYTKR